LAHFSPAPWEIISDSTAEGEGERRHDDRQQPHLGGRDG
jgi:hypothetical protein